MQIIDMVPFADRGSGPTRTIARFSVSLPEIKLCGFRLKRRADGSVIIDAPAVQGNRMVHFAPDLFKEIIAAADAAFRRLDAKSRA